MLLKNVFLYTLVAAAAAKPIKRGGGRKKCSSVHRSTTGTSDHASTTPGHTGSSSIIVSHTTASDSATTTPGVSTSGHGNTYSPSSTDVSQSTTTAHTGTTTPHSSDSTAVSTDHSTGPGSSSQTGTPVSSDQSSTTGASSTGASTTGGNQSNTPSSTTGTATTSATGTTSTDGSSTTGASTTGTSSSTGASTTGTSSSTGASSSTGVTSTTSTSASTTSTISTTSAPSSTTSTSSSAAPSSTAAIRPRPVDGGLPAGQIYNSCTQPNVVALTFDDGPFQYTAKALDLLDAEGFKATFFLNGQNWGSIYDYSAVVQRIYNTGHQVGSHTWSHADLGTLDAAGVESQLIQVETALTSIIGKYSTWLRAPYLSTSGQALPVAANLGYKIAGIDIDTKDYEHTADPQTAVNNFVAGLNAGGSIALAHDVHQSTVDVVLPGMIAAIKQKGYRAVTLQECFGLTNAQGYSTLP